MHISALIFITLAAASCSSRTSTSKPADAKAQTWGTVPIGTVYETKTVTRMAKPFLHETQSTTKQTLLARTDAEASIKLEISGAAPQDVTIPLQQHAFEPAHGSVTTSDERCTVPAGTFDCTKTTIEIHEGDATRSTVTWTTKSIPVPLMTVVTNETMTTTTELTNVALR